MISAVLASFIRILNLWFSGRIAAAIGTDLSCMTYSKLLYQPYHIHVKSNSSKPIAVSTTHVQNTVVVVNLALQLTISAVIAIFILSALIIADIFLSICLILLFGSVYLLLAFLAKKRLVSNSRSVAESQQLQVKSLQEGLGSIRDMILDRSQNYYLQEYKKYDANLRLKQANSVFIGSFPRYVLEALGICSLSIIAVFLTWQYNENNFIIPILGTLALGSQRLLPCMQQIYSTHSAIKSLQASVNEVFKILDHTTVSSSKSKTYVPLNKLQLICLSNVCFKYSSDGKKVLDEINLQIKPGTKVGLIGTTGSGKSTLVDILMGLLKPTSGEVFYGTDSIYESESKLLRLRDSIAHVPQSIYLTDRSIAENIAIGMHFDDINMQKVKEVLPVAQISDFIESLPQSYNTIIGERGALLSGGQRQRIGIESLI